MKIHTDKTDIINERPFFSFVAYLIYTGKKDKI